MKAVSVLSTPTLLAEAGNRDFLHIYNNGSETIYLCYDGDPRAIGTYGAGRVVETIPAGNIISGFTLSGLSPVPSLGAIILQTGGFPTGILVISITKTSSTSGQERWSVVTTPFTVIGSGITSGDSVLFNCYDLDVDSNPVQLTTARGWPVPAANWFNLDNDGNRNVFNKPVYAIAATGPVDVRIEGA